MKSCCWVTCFENHYTWKGKPVPRILGKILQKIWHVYYKMMDETASSELKQMERAVRQLTDQQQGLEIYYTKHRCSEHQCDKETV